MMQNPPGSSRFLVPERLETGRLVLRMFGEADWPAYHAYCSDAESTRYTFRRALSESESWYALANMLGHWQLRGYGPYALEEKSSGNVLGTAGLWYPKEWPEAEIKWALVRCYRGKGFAGEAARAVQAMARQHVPHLSPISLIHPENAASVKLALAVGARFEKEVPFRGALWHVYRHPS